MDWPFFHYYIHTKFSTQLLAFSKFTFDLPYINDY